MPRAILLHVNETSPAPSGIVKREAAFVREHIAWVVGLAALVFASARMLVASGGNAEMLKSLVQDLNVTALVLATLLPFTSTVLFWIFIVSLLVSVGRKIESRKIEAPTQRRKKASRRV